MSTNKMKFGGKNCFFIVFAQTFQPPRMVAYQLNARKRYVVKTSYLFNYNTDTINIHLNIFY